MNSIFIIRLKKNLKIIPVYLEDHNDDFVELGNSSNFKIKLLQSDVIQLTVNPDENNLNKKDLT